MVQFLLLLHGQISRVLQKGKGGGGAKLFHALGQTEGLPGRVQDGTALGAQIGETLEPIFPLGKGLFQDTQLAALGQVSGLEGCGPGLPGGGKGAVTAGQRFQGTLSLGQIDLGLGQVPGCLLVVGPGLSKGLPGFIQPFCFVPGDGVEKAHGPLGFQGGHLLFRGLPGLPAGFRLDGEDLAPVCQGSPLGLQLLFPGRLGPQLPESKKVIVLVCHNGFLSRWAGAEKRDPSRGRVPFEGT